MNNPGLQMHNFTTICTPEHYAAGKENNKQIKINKLTFKKVKYTNVDIFRKFLTELGTRCFCEKRVLTPTGINPSAVIYISSMLKYVVV